ncbi:MAG: DUF1351 domain-containing protein [Ruminococcus sp.]|nr:DUF1351 domain-containing protein [Ruminococcus sp.]
MKFTVVNKTFELPVAISNFEELRQAIMPKISFYKSLVVTEDTVKSAKSDRAELNRLKKVIDDERKKIKACYLMPYQAIEDECKQLIDLIDEPIKAIDGQLKAIDEQALQVKKQALEEHFRGENPPDFIRLEDVLPVRWKNKSEKTESLKAEISAKISVIKTDFDYLNNMYSDSPHRTAILRKFTETLDKSETLSYAVELARSETLCNAPVSDSVSGNVITLPDSADTVTGSYSGSQTVSGVFRVICSTVQLRNLCAFMVKNGIKFKSIREDKNNG